MLKLDRVAFALGLIGLGILSLVHGDFALQWQPVLVWVPLVVQTPTSQLPWTGLLISWTIAAAAWVVAGSLLSKPSAASRDALATMSSRRSEASVGIHRP